MYLFQYSTSFYVISLKSESNQEKKPNKHKLKGSLQNNKVTFFLKNVNFLKDKGLGILPTWEIKKT